MHKAQNNTSVPRCSFPFIFNHVQWVAMSCLPHFSISPVSGSFPPNTQLSPFIKNFFSCILTGLHFFFFFFNLSALQSMLETSTWLISPNTVGGWPKASVTSLPSGSSRRHHMQQDLIPITADSHSVSTCNACPLFQPYWLWTWGTTHCPHYCPYAWP